MEVTSSLNADDVVALDRYLASRSRLRRWHVFAIMFAVMIAVPVWEFIRFPSAFSNFLHNGGVFLLFAVGFMFVGEWLRQRRGRAAQKAPGYWDPCTAGIAPDHFYYSDGTGSVTGKWRNLHDVAEGEQHIFWLLTKDQAYLIPKRAFKSGEEAQEFYRAARAYWEQAKRDTSPRH